MKYLVLVKLICFVLSAKSQIISNADYSKMITNSDAFPDNITTRLEAEGFELMYNSSSQTTINVTYKLKSDDPWFYNTMVSRRAASRAVILTFNSNSGEYVRLSSDIVKRMVRQPKSKYCDYRVTFYKDANNIYFGIYKDDESVPEEKKTFQIAIYNFAEYKEMCLTNFLDKTN